MTERNSSRPIRGVERLILEVRGHKVLLDQDLAELYGVTTKALNQAVSRNPERFPEDFAFRLSRAEAENLRSQTVTSSSKGHGGRRWLPRVFTEEGVAMLSSVLRNDRAVAVNIAIMRAFVRVRQVLAGQEALLQRLDDLESRTNRHDDHFRAVFKAIRKLIEAPPVPERRRIGFDEE